MAAAGPLRSLNRQSPHRPAWPDYSPTNYAQRPQTGPSLNQRVRIPQLACRAGPSISPLSIDAERPAPSDFLGRPGPLPLRFRSNARTRRGYGCSPAVSGLTPSVVEPGPNQRVRWGNGMTMPASSSAPLIETATALRTRHRLAMSAACQ